MAANINLNNTRTDLVIQYILINSNSQYSIVRDLALVIFEKAQGNLHNMSQVCKNWNLFADDEQLYKNIYPPQAYGTQAWKDGIDVDAGEELRLPKRIYSYLEKGNYLLTFIPKNVKITDDHGVVREVALDNLLNIAILFKRTKTNWLKAVEGGMESRQHDESHWVLINKDVIGRNQTFEQQQALAKKAGDEISWLIDTVISVFMRYTRSGEGNFVIEPSSFKGTVVRVNETTDGWRICFGFDFTPSSIYLSKSCDEPHQTIGVALARKYFGNQFAATKE